MSKLPLGNMYRKARANRSEELIERRHVYHEFTDTWREVHDDTEWFEFELREYKIIAIVKRVFSDKLYLMMTGHPLIEVRDVAHAKAIFAALK